MKIGVFSSGCDGCGVSASVGCSRSGMPLISGGGRAGGSAEVTAAGGATSGSVDGSGFAGACTMGAGLALGSGAASLLGLGGASVLTGLFTGGITGAGCSTTVAVGAGALGSIGAAAGKGLTGLGAGACNSLVCAAGCGVDSVTVGADGLGGLALLNSGTASSNPGKPRRRGSTLNGAAVSARAGLTHSVPADSERKANAVTRYRGFIMVLPDGKGAKIA